MNEELKAFFQKMVNKDYDQLLEEGKMTIAAVISILKKHDFKDEDIGVFLALFISAAVASDGKYSALEQKFMNDLFGTIDVVVPSAVDTALYDKLNKFVDVLPSDEKVILCHLAVIIAAVDQTIDKNELAYILELLA